MKTIKKIDFDIVSKTKASTPYFQYTIKMGECQRYL